MPIHLLDVLLRALKTVARERTGIQLMFNGFRLPRDYMDLIPGRCREEDPWGPCKGLRLLF